MARQEIFKTELGRRLREIRTAIGDQQRDEFSNVLGIHSRSVANYERGDNQPNSDVLLAYREKFGVNVHWILTGEGQMFDGGATPKSEKTLITLPYFAAEAAAGFGRIALEELPEGAIAFDRAFLRNQGGSPENCFVMTARGDSMQPTLPDGSLLIVDKSQNEDIAHGCIYVFRFGEVLLVKRARWRIDGKLELVSDNTVYPTETLDRTHAHELSVLGRVIYFCRAP
ncbi:XRE family transcriptional regulator [Martelella endophytica]|uniref:HTH cro/C1-type domain-containing protein n=1 Tax=Martelella endophytica TaxID=1486262 RepID=A0A0D5LQW9_MAREN|nr:S24 family peptidase [Martelella endophytica]AJY46506.1 hypothetical protein TM49_13780 [Martelella endophytica]